MVFQSPSGIEQNRKIQLVLATILAVSIAIFFMTTRSRAPDVRSVYGTYHNDCCHDIIISGSSISYGASSVPLRLSDMKFGLTGYVRGRFTREGITPAGEETTLSFSGDAEKSTISLPIEGRDYTFQLTSP